MANHDGCGGGGVDVASVASVATVGVFVVLVRRVVTVARHSMGVATGVNVGNACMWVLPPPVSSLLVVLWCSKDLFLQHHRLWHLRPKHPKPRGPRSR